MIFPSSLATAIWLAFSPAPSQTACIPQLVPQPVQGQTLYCCTNPDGMQCCSESITPDGVVNGCGCSQ